MKEITLKFREVAVDGLPEESMDCAVVSQYYEKQPNTLCFSSKYGYFNVRDHDRPEDAERQKIMTVIAWYPLKQFNEAYDGGVQDVQTLD